MMYSFESSGSRKPLHAMVVGSLIGALVLFSISTIQGIPVPYLFQLGAVDMWEYIINGRNAHLNARIALPQQLDGILFDHKSILLVCGRLF